MQRDGVDLLATVTGEADPASPGDISSDGAPDGAESCRQILYLGQGVAPTGQNPNVPSLGHQRRHEGQHAAARSWKEAGLLQAGPRGEAHGPQAAVPRWGPCWGEQLAALSEVPRDHVCDPDFVPGTGHLVTKFCHRCRQGFHLPPALCRAVTPELQRTFSNGAGSGVWSNANLEGVSRSIWYRLFNNAKKCRGPMLVVFAESPPPPLQWAPLPPEWIDASGLLRVTIAKGTIVPVCSLLRRYGMHAECNPPPLPPGYPRPATPSAMLDHPAPHIVGMVAGVPKITGGHNAHGWAPPIAPMVRPFAPPAAPWPPRGAPPQQGREQPKPELLYPVTAATATTATTGGPRDARWFAAFQPSGCDTGPPASAAVHSSVTKRPRDPEPNTSATAARREHSIEQPPSSQPTSTVMRRADGSALSQSEVDAAEALAFADAPAAATAQGAMYAAQGAGHAAQASVSDTTTRPRLMGDLKKGLHGIEERIAELEDELRGLKAVRDAILREGREARPNAALQC